jgi:quercetin dioxygenase-like cupin family protein
MAFFRHLVSQASFSPQHQIAKPLYQSESFTVMLIGFEPGQSIPEHPGPAGAFYVVEGEGWITIDGNREEVSPGTVAIVPQNVRRSIDAQTRMTILVSRGVVP